jgi:hypothetical protein
VRYTNVRLRISKTRRTPQTQKAASKHVGSQVHIHNCTSQEGMGLRHVTRFAAAVTQVANGGVAWKCTSGAQSDYAIRESRNRKRNCFKHHSNDIFRLKMQVKGQELVSMFLRWCDDRSPSQSVGTCLSTWTRRHALAGLRPHCDDDDDELNVDKPSQACTAAASANRRRLASRPAPSQPPVKSISFRPGRPSCADCKRRGCNERTPKEPSLTSS